MLCMISERPFLVPTVRQPVTHTTHAAAHSHQTEPTIKDASHVHILLTTVTQAENWRFQKYLRYAPWTQRLVSYSEGTHRSGVAGAVAQTTPGRVAAGGRATAVPQLSTTSRQLSIRQNRDRQNTSTRSVPKTDFAIAGVAAVKQRPQGT